MESANSLIPLYGAVYHDGPLYFSSLASTGFYGVTCMQTFFYYVHYPKDPLRMKSFVAVLWALDTIHEGLTVAGAYKYIFAGLVDPLATGILDPNPEIAIPFSETLVSIPVQAFFVHRIYNVSGKNIVIPLLWAIQSIYQIVVSILYVARAFHMVDGKLNVVGALVLDDRFFLTIVTSSLSLSAAVDVLIAITMTYLLLRMKNTTGFANTAHTLQRLTIFAVNTGTWTALFSVLSVILLRLYPSTFLHALTVIPLSSLYCNTLLANLNARAYMRDGETTPVFDDTNPEKQNGVVFSSPHQNTGAVAEFTDAASSTAAENGV